ncbi:hypothetical protein I4U23_019890 [Adineta vaga]|nr:hypothetical protein I4U23_019890 [Adineta vaga]
MCAHHLVSISYLLRSNIANAKLVGLEDDLKTTSTEYLWSLSIFFVGYTFFEVPSNIVRRRWKPSKWISVIHILLKAGLFSEIVYYLSIWYLKKQPTIRVGSFWSISALLGAFGSILAYDRLGLEDDLKTTSTEYLCSIKDFEEWTPLQTQLMTIPTNIAAFFAILIFSCSSDYVSLTRRATASAVIIPIGVSGAFVSGQIYDEQIQLRVDKYDGEEAAGDRHSDFQYIL